VHATIWKLPSRMWQVQSAGGLSSHSELHVAACRTSGLNRAACGRANSATSSLLILTHHKTLERDSTSNPTSNPDTTACAY